MLVVLDQRTHVHVVAMLGRFQPHKQVFALSQTDRVCVLLRGRVAWSVPTDDDR